MRGTDDMAQSRREFLKSAGVVGAVAVAADWVGLAEGYDDWERRLVCLAECVDHLAFDALRHSEFAYAKASESEFSTGAFLAAVEAERGAEAEGLVVRAGDGWARA